MKRRCDEDEPVRFFNLFKCPAHGKDGAVGAAHVDTNGAAGTRVELVHSAGEVMRAPPLCEMLGFGPHLEDEATRGVEDAGEGKFLSDDVGGGVIYGACCHVSSPDFWARNSVTRADTHPGGRSFLPRSGGSARPSRRCP